MRNQISDETYNATAAELAKRIEALIPEHPEIMTMEDPNLILKIEGFVCEDLAPSFFQVSWALRKAQNDFQLKQT